MTTDEKTPQAPPSKEALDAVHSFPCRYDIKAFGENDDIFLLEITALVTEMVPDGSGEVTPRISGKGRYLCATIGFHAQHANHVQSLYIELQRIDGLRMLL
ncbi:MAG: putative lipoic acid-binding regulatory protein [Bradymonadia bacterium]|jgi:putative lipoic acid-binding regulatory protein